MRDFPATLYRVYNAAGLLLYVGIAFEWIVRVESHRRGAHWFWEASSIRLQHFKSRLDAAKAERTAIRKEKPLYNIAGIGALASCKEPLYKGAHGRINHGAGSRRRPRRYDKNGSLDGTAPPACDQLESKRKASGQYFRSAAARVGAASQKGSGKPVGDDGKREYGPMSYIREEVLGVSQSALARIARVNQATISRWEAGRRNPKASHMARIRDYARRKGIRWSDRWFFEAAA